MEDLLSPFDWNINNEKFMTFWFSSTDEPKWCNIYYNSDTHFFFIIYTITGSVTSL
jgi:hypothetical protein